MTTVDRLSDTVYRDQARKRLDDLVGDGKVPVERAQIYGLRHIARQQPGNVREFAQHQRERAERKQENVSESVRPSLQAEIDFWSLVDDLCGSRTKWSVRREGLAHAPQNIREENIPTKSQCNTDADRTLRNQLKKRQRAWLHRWTCDHVPAFFERFCTDALYRRETQVINLERNTT